MPSTPKSPHPPLIVVWQSLVVAGYRSFFYELQKVWQGPIYLVAPQTFIELGSQSRDCDAFDRNASIPPERCFAVPTYSRHVQIVWFRGLSSIIATIAKGTPQTPCILSIAEPYSFTALFCYLQAKAALRVRFSFFTYALQNIDKPFSRPIALIEKLVFWRCRAILTLGAGQTAVLRAHGFGGLLIDFPLWFDSVRFGVRLSREEALSALSKTKSLQLMNSVISKPTIGFCGSMTSEKGIFDLLKLFEQSPDFAARYQLVLAGGGRALEQVLATVRKLKGLGLAVIHFGGLSLELMPAFYSLVDVLVVPSRTAPNWKEQFGRTIVEAQACGTVVVGSDSGEIPQVVADSSRIFSEGNLAQMEACITRAMTVDTKARIAMQEKNSARFSDRALAAKFAANIERILV